MGGTCAIKFVFFVSPVNLSHINLIVRPAKEPRRVEKNFHLYIKYYALLSQFCENTDGIMEIQTNSCCLMNYNF